MKFDQIKANAKRIYAGTMGEWDRGPVTGFSPLLKGSRSAFDALIPFVLATQDEREEMREFAQAFEAKPSDWLANAAKSDRGKPLDTAWNQVVLRAREAGLEIIDNWDVRRVGKLIELFPESVPAKLRGKPLICEMGVEGDCDWIVVAEKPKRPSFGL